MRMSTDDAASIKEGADSVRVSATAFGVLRKAKGAAPVTMPRLICCLASRALLKLVDFNQRYAGAPVLAHHLRGVSIWRELNHEG